MSVTTTIDDATGAAAPDSTPSVPPHPAKIESTILCETCDRKISLPLRNYHTAVHDETIQTIGRDLYDQARYLNVVEREEINDRLSEARQSVILLEKELSSLDRATKAIRQMRSQQGRYISFLANLLTPIGELPNELLLVIFRLCVPHRKKDEVVNLTPLRLSLVCSRWREIMLSSKELWMFTHINVDEQRGQKDRQTLKDYQEDVGARTARSADILHLYFARSHPAALSVSVQGIHRHVTQHPLLDILASQSCRWLNADLRLLYAYFEAGEPLDKIINNLPMLERMSFFNDGVEHPTTNHFANSPKLTHARTFESSALLLPWRQITNLQESGCQAPHILQKIKSCPHLRDLAILEL